MVTLEFEFPSKAHLEAFTGWFSNVGEQDFYQQADYEEGEDKQLYNVHFKNTTPEKIEVVQIEEDE